MGNKINKEYQSTCPLIDQRKIILEKNIPTIIIGLGVLNYKDKDFILLLLFRGNIEVYNSENLELVSKSNNEMKYDCNGYIGNLINEYFVVIGESSLRIYALYEDNTDYNLKLVQKIDNQIQINENLIYTQFYKAFILDRNLYKEYDIYEMEKNRKEKNILSNESELIINSTKGIFVYKKDENEDENSDKFDFYDKYEKWKKNPYECKEQITCQYNYDIIQVNFKYIAGTIHNFLCLYSMETYELVTKFDIKTSDECDCIMFMLNEDILCIGGDDSITLISIKNFEIVLVSLIKAKFRITEICILPDFNILIGMQNNDDSDSIKEYFYQYKYNYIMNTTTKKMEHKIIQGTSKLLTKNHSNIMMRCLNNNRIVIAVEYKKLQILE